MSQQGAALGGVVLAATLWIGAPLVWSPPPPEAPLVEHPSGGWGAPPDGAVDFRHGDRVEEIDGVLRAAPPSQPLAFGRPLDLNTASAEALQALPGLGPALAARVVASREQGGPFASVDELERVRGIGPATRVRVAPWLTVGE